MMKSISRRRFMGHAAAAGAVAVAAGVPTSGFGSGAEAGNRPPVMDDLNFVHPLGPGDIPDLDHILPQGRGWKVLPTGIDDHDNLEWALRHTVSGGTVRLVSGVYKVGRPIVVADFDGVLAGAGAARTTITCTDELSVELWEMPGGGKERGALKPPPFPRVPVDSSITRTPPGVFLFYKTPVQLGQRRSDRANRIEIGNLRYRGSMAGEPWMVGDETIFISIVNSLDWDHPGSGPETTRQDVVISGIVVDGYSSPEFGPFENACSCISVAGGLVLTSNYDLNGDVDGDAAGAANGGLLRVTPAEGDVTINSCSFRNCRFGPGVVGYRHGTIRLLNNVTDGCRANCLQLLDIGNADVIVANNDLRCDAFTLPPELAGWKSDVPSSLGCVVAVQGAGAAIGYPFNARWAALAFDGAAHAAHPEAGPLGTWRPQGPSAAPLPSTFRIVDNACASSAIPNTYCVHVVDAAHLAFGVPTMQALVPGNACAGSETCVSLEHVASGFVAGNECSSQAFGIELHNSSHTTIAGNRFHFPAGVGCEIRQLELGEKLDLSRALPGAGVCFEQR